MTLPPPPQAYNHPAPPALPSGLVLPLHRGAKKSLSNAVLNVLGMIAEHIMKPPAPQGMPLEATILAHPHMCLYTPDHAVDRGAVDMVQCHSWQQGNCDTLDWSDAHGSISAEDR